MSRRLPYARASDLVGRRIVKVALPTRPAGAGYGRGRYHVNNELELDNGALLRFLVEEAEDDYGVAIIYVPPRKVRDDEETKDPT